MYEYQIVNKQQVTVPALTGGFAQAWRITYKLTDGTVGNVTVADGPTMAQAAKDAICAQIDQFAELHQLGT